MQYNASLAEAEKRTRLMDRNRVLHSLAWPMLMVAVATLCWVPPAAAADVGPKPSADIRVTYQGQPLPGGRCYARMLACGTAESLPDARCTFADAEACRRLSAVEIRDAGQGCTWRPSPLAWGGDCQDGQCHFSYFLPDRFRLAVYLPTTGQVFVSDPVTRPNFDSTFQADLLADGTARVVETTPPLRQGQLISFLVALLLTLPLELLVALRFARRLPARRRVWLAVLLANLLSLPLVWFLFPRLVPPLLAVILGEVFAVVFEAGVIHLLSRRALSLARSLALSGLANAASLFVGGALLLVLTFLGLTR
jgi:hypothetical protein